MRRLHPAALFPSDQSGFQHHVSPSAVALHTWAWHGLAAGFWCMAVGDSRGSTCTDPLAQPQSHTEWGGDPQQLSDPQREGKDQDTKLLYLAEPGTHAWWHQGRKAFHLPTASCCLLLTPEEPKKNVRIVTVLGKEDLFWVTVRHFMVFFEPCKLESW